MTAKALRRRATVFIGTAAVLLCSACTSAPQRVREQASSALACDTAQVMVNRTERRYFRDDIYEAEGCGQKATYQCERAYVLFIPVGTMACRRK